MANSLTDYGRELFLGGSFSWNAGTVYMSFVSNTGGTGYAAASAAVTAPYTGYRSNLANTTVLQQNLYPNTLGQVAFGTVVTGGPGGGFGPTIGSGIAGASDTTVNSVPAGSASGTISAIVLWTPTTIASSGVASAALAWIDTAASGLPIVPNGGNITVSWSRGTNLIFKL